MTKSTCPDCKRTTKHDIKNGYVQCRGCWQMLLIEGKKVKKAIPKELF